MKTSIKKLVSFTYIAVVATFPISHAQNADVIKAFNDKILACIHQTLKEEVECAKAYHDKIFYLTNLSPIGKERSIDRQIIRDIESMADEYYTEYYTHPNKEIRYLVLRTQLLYSTYLLLEEKHKEIEKLNLRLIKDFRYTGHQSEPYDRAINDMLLMADQNLAITYLRYLAQPEKAKRHIDRMIEYNNPSYYSPSRLNLYMQKMQANGLLMRGEYYETTQQPNEAIKAYSKLISIYDSIKTSEVLGIVAKGLLQRGKLYLTANMHVHARHDFRDIGDIYSRIYSNDVPGMKKIAQEAKTLYERLR